MGGIVTAWADYSREEILSALAANDWVLERTAKALGMVVNTLKTRMDRLGIPRIRRDFEEGGEA